MARAAHSRARSAVGGLTVLLLLGTGGCRREEAPPSPAPPALQEDAGARATGREPARLGVQVPMPPGWAARIGPDGSFQAGPPGTTLLRIDRRPRAGTSLPSPAELRAGLEGQVKQGRLERVTQEEGEGLSLLFFEVVRNGGADAGRREALPGMVGAKAVGEDLYLCASTPGAGAADVRAAAEACRALTVRAASAEAPRDH